MLRPLSIRLAALAAALLLAPLALWGASPLVADGAQTPEQVRSDVRRGKAQERSLASAAQRLGRLERALTGDIAVLQRRLDSVRADLTRAQTRLGQTQGDLRVQRVRAVRLRRRLAQSRELLGRRLRELYTSSDPDLVTIVLSSHDFADLLERTEFLRRIRRADEHIVEAVRRGRADARRQSIELAGLERRQQDAVVAVRSQRDALGRMETALQGRRATLARARAARLAALRATRADRRSAERELSRLLAERAAAARQTAGPGGPWAIPWAIVECESGGQNLPPNWAGASGYYQFMPDTWQGLGGSTPQAYQAPKAEQDRLAAQLWNGGAGAANWDCAALVAGG
jgi:peptidoglycan hydrolase CwlO-like protein